MNTNIILKKAELKETSFNINISISAFVDWISNGNN